MNAVASMQFSEFFVALYGYGPFPWQAELARRVAEAQPGDDCWPQALALPTAAGKTACIDMAIFALACQSDRSPLERTAPRRIFFVVDRRVIVDETFTRAQKLADKLREARKGADGILKDVADRLCSLALIDDADDADDPLACFQLRGGMYRDDAWARSPLQPTVVVTTVDQFGSRLLFRGYGSSAGMRPVHAGLAANDCLILLDEAHCANPFRQTISSVQRYREWASQSGSIGATPFHLTLISATPPQDIADKECFTAGDGDLQHSVLGRRINASKPAKLVVSQSARGDNALERLAQQIGDEAVKLVSEERKAIGVMVNRVATAKLVYENLRKADKDVTLLTGRMRAIDRDDVVRDLESLKTGAEREERTRFIVATQTLEVGADLDFDGLVTECASLDALRQRFGRLNRDGRSIDATAAIVVRADQTNPNSKTAEDPVYGTALTETWQWLKERANKDEIDFGFAAMDTILPDRPELGQLCQQAADAPVMLPAHVDAWAQTSPTPAPDPDPAIFLHGPNRGAPEVQVCWRADLSQADLSGDGEQAVDIVSLCPPASSECISVPIHVLQRWLEGTGGDAASDDSDVEGTLAPDDGSPLQQRQVRRSVLCWRGPAEGRPIVSRADLHPGDTVVIPAESEGWDVFGHIPVNSDGNQVIDLGDRAHLQSRAKAILRIHTRTVESWPEVRARAFFKDIAGKSEASEGWEELTAEIPGRLKELAVQLEELAKETGEISHWQWLTDVARALTDEYRIRRPKQIPYPNGGEEDSDAVGLTLQGSRRVQKYMGTASTLTSEDDFYSATVRVTLDDHLLGVESWAKRFGKGIGLPDSLTTDLALAARLHDVGKADPRFQVLLHGGSTWAAQVGGALLAKSDRLPAGRAEYQRVRRQSEYPVGGRHELLSVRLIESVPGLLESDHDWDLVLHLVASHHGYCRPFAPVVSDGEPVKVEETILDYQMSACSDTGLERLDSGVPERFWRLVRRYGWWGLAWLEALMRLADHRRSGAEQKNHENADSHPAEAAR